MNSCSAVTVHFSKSAVRQGRSGSTASPCPLVLRRGGYLDVAVVTTILPRHLIVTVAVAVVDPANSTQMSSGCPCPFPCRCSRSITTSTCPCPLMRDLGCVGKSRRSDRWPTAKCGPAPVARVALLPGSSGSRAPRPCACPRCHSGGLLGSRRRGGVDGRPRKEAFC